MIFVKYIVNIKCRFLVVAGMT